MVQRRRVIIAFLAVLGVAGVVSFRQGSGPDTPLLAESLPSRLSDDAVARMLRQAGLDLKEKLALA